MVKQTNSISITTSRIANSNTYLIDQLKTGIIYTPYPALLTDIVITPDNNVIYALTTYQFDVTTKNEIGIDGYLIITFPTEIVILGSSFQFDISSSTFSGIQPLSKQSSGTMNG